MSKPGALEPVLNVQNPVDSLLSQRRKSNSLPLKNNIEKTCNTGAEIDGKLVR